MFSNHTLIRHGNLWKSRDSRVGLQVRKIIYSFTTYIATRRTAISQLSSNYLLRNYLKANSIKVNISFRMPQKSSMKQLLYLNRSGIKNSYRASLEAMVISRGFLLRKAR